MGAEGDDVGPARFGSMPPMKASGAARQNFVVAESNIDLRSRNRVLPSAPIDPAVLIRTPDEGEAIRRNALPNKVRVFRPMALNERATSVSDDHDVSDCGTGHSVLRNTQNITLLEKLHALPIKN